MVTLEDYDSHLPLRAPMTVAGGFNEKDRKVFKENNSTKKKAVKKSK